MSDWIPRSALAAPFSAPQPVDQLGRSLWLYLHLLRLANPRGIALRTSDRLVEDLAIPKAMLEEWLGRLAGARLAEIQSPAPYLVIKLPFWSGTTDTQREDSDLASASNGSGALEVPVSSKQQQAAAFNQAGEGGLGEGEALVAEVVRVLGGADANEVRGLIAEFPKPVVLKALIRVKTTPSSQIRKSKLALFRYLLAKFAANPHAH